MIIFLSFVGEHNVLAAFLFGMVYVLLVLMYMGLYFGRRKGLLRECEQVITACNDLSNEEFEGYIERKEPEVYEAIRALRCIVQNPELLLEGGYHKSNKSLEIKYSLNGKVENICMEHIESEERTDIEEDTLVWLGMPGAIMQLVYRNLVSTE